MTRQEIINAIQHDNKRIEIYNKAMAHVLDILKKYNGKPYGEKTRAKISNELKAACGCALYLNRSYQEDISIIPLNDQGYTDYRFSYNDFCVYVKYPQRDKRRVLTADNKVNGDFTYEDFQLCNCPEYIHNPEEHADNIIYSFKVLQEQYKKFEDSMYTFNHMLPSKMEDKHVQGFRNYL